jgi:hypothetical protein
LSCVNTGESIHADLSIDKEERYRKLVRRGFLTPGYELTELGQNVINEVAPKESDNKRKTLNLAKKIVVDSSPFDEFWNTFPKNDKYAHHVQSRVLRADRLRAAVYYEHIIKSGKATSEQLLNALKKDIEMRERASLGKQNEFKYMPAIAAWLNKGVYEAYLGEEENKPKGDNYGESVE